jgi:3-oxoacyl-[acyl-carrier-protein] synthase-3
VAVRVADEGPAVEMAVEAANLALKRSGVDPGEVSLVLHACCAHQGLEHLAASSYVQSRTVQGIATAVEVNQYSNGCMAALELAAGSLANQPIPASALLTTSDRFAAPAYDRYRCDQGVVFGDGATGLVLSRRPGVARLQSTVVIGDASFVGMQIGDAPWTDAPDPSHWPVDLTARRKQHLARHGVDLLMRLMVTATRLQRLSIEMALAEAELTPDQVAWWVVPNMGRAVVDWEFRRRMGIAEARTTWAWGREVGHLGAGDQFAGLAHLFESGAVRVGDRVALTGVGQGDNYSCAVVEVLEEPDWETSAS